MLLPGRPGILIQERNRSGCAASAKGSSGWSAVFHMTRLTGAAPKALLFNEMTTKIALGAVVMRVPSITDFDQDPLAVIETGDWVKVDADPRPRRSH